MEVVLEKKASESERQRQICIRCCNLDMLHNLALGIMQKLKICMLAYLPLEAEMFKRSKGKSEKKLLLF